MEPQLIDEILGYLVDTLGGDWLLAGGTLVRLSFDADRGTEDIDLARMGHPEMSGEASLDQFYRWLISKGRRKMHGRLRRSEVPVVARGPTLTRFEERRANLGI